MSDHKQLLRLAQWLACDNFCPDQAVPIPWNADSTKQENHGDYHQKLNQSKSLHCWMLRQSFLLFEKMEILFLYNKRRKMRQNVEAN